MENYVDPIEEQYNRIQNESRRENNLKNKVKYDVKNYLNVRVDSNKTEKELNIRIFRSLGKDKSPFSEVHVHFLPSEKKSYICTKKTKNLPEGSSTECPFCDLREEARLAQKGASEAVYEKYKKIYKDNNSNINYIVKVIDRDDESFGVKFWKMTQPTYETIIDIYRAHKKHGIDIFDAENGRDITITIKKKEGKDKITSIVADIVSTKLSSDEQNINSILNDSKVWSDVYGVKPYEYLSLVISGKKPFFDKEKGLWVEKIENSDDENEDEGDSSVNFHEAPDADGNSDELPF